MTLPVTDTARTRLRAAGYSCEDGCGLADGSFLEIWVREARILILHDMKEDGFDIYKPASPRNDAEATMKGAGI